MIVYDEKSDHSLKVAMYLWSRLPYFPGATPSSHTPITYNLRQQEVKNRIYYIRKNRFYEDSKAISMLMYDQPSGRWRALGTLINHFPINLVFRLFYNLFKGGRRNDI